MGGIGQIGSDAYRRPLGRVTASPPAGVPAYTVNRFRGSGLRASGGKVLERT